MRVTLPVAHLRGQQLAPRTPYPVRAEATASWDPASGSVTVGLPRAGTAWLLRLTT